LDSVEPRRQRLGNEDRTLRGVLVGVLREASWVVTVSEWSQAVSAAAAAVAAVFAWRAVRQVKKTQEFERRVGASEQLRTIYLLITDLVVEVHKEAGDTFESSMRLRAQLAVSYSTGLRTIRKAQPRARIIGRAPPAVSRRH
jgi:hypothetical protein